MPSTAIADTDNRRVREVTASGTITTLAGDGTYPMWDLHCYPTTPGAINPVDLTLDRSGNLYVVDDSAILKRSPSGQWTTVTGASGDICADPFGLDADGGPAANALLDYPQGLTTDAAGDLYVAELGRQALRVITPTPASSTRLAVTARPGRLTAREFDIRYTVDAGARLALVVTPKGGPSMTVATGTLKQAGSGTLRWNRKLDGRFAHWPWATMAVTATSGEQRAASDVRIAGLHPGMAVKVSPHSVTVSYGYFSPFPGYWSSVTPATRVALRVAYPHRRPVVVAQAAFGPPRTNFELVWNRQLNGRPAPHGKPQLSVVMTTGLQRATSSTLTVTL